MKYSLTLFVTGRTAQSQRAIENLRRVCDSILAGQCAIEVVDVLENPQRAEEAKILATPTLVRRMPLPVRKVIGDLSNREMLLHGLDLLPTAAWGLDKETNRK